MKRISLAYCQLKDISSKKKHTVKPLDYMIKPIIAIATVVIQLPYTLMIMIIEQKPENHIAISENMLGLKTWLTEFICR